MPIGTVTSKGQITIPKEVRDKLRLKAGSRINFIVDSFDRVTFSPINTDFRTLKGMVKSRRKKAMSIEEMDEAIARSACE